MVHAYGPVIRESNELDCPQICPDVQMPVTDEEGNMYPNECYMKRTKCEQNNAKTEPPLWPTNNGPSSN
ncbi:hypothetical protein F441_09440 [Phytophthora nicotianae CJ01A1]|uniref:Kazal-like domain-containing protein n=4 Tax=Phytophthora nicotianae TaxID=4792 RepID=V9F6U4_PHYNI|nr:hypothetical protein F443_09485 [Phytophthora nicotianae P1569]ETL39461.1 hypothetical protein L916_09208 [Phytophthora nicotianae]ETO74765.1 hypothetical protein F444_09565 [Phytophthora nicotianae P1976]ETP15899.1 hypothetical protein F441_09440 [Phytophthora nicotianae CJ01A1]ETL92595.1 hypothetical protein L917_09132 [Phytophthora nicotianae]